MRVLISGGAGFIGSHLCDFLVKKGITTYCLDNLITGSKGNINHLIKNKNFTFKQFDIINPFDEVMVSEFNNLSGIFNLASPASPVDYQNYPEETALVNSVGTYNLLQLAVKNNAKFLMASTSETYGDPKEHPQKETYWGNVNPYGPRSCYDESKRFSESLTYVFVKKYNLDARVIRIFNTYGPRMQKDDGRVVSNFINQALEGKPLTVYGKGRQTRSFCYVSDLVDGIYKAMFEKGTQGGVFNLGNPQEYTIMEFARKIIDLTALKSKIVYKALPKDDPTKRKPDISKAKKILGWEPKVSVDEGLKKTIEYYKSIK
jgi:dTDP-glucose 4,6-dehydratase